MDKVWDVDGHRYPDGSQPAGLGALLTPTGPHQHLTVTNTVTCAPPDGDHHGGYGDGQDGSGGKRGSGGGGR
ncbi:hypothetical protein [Streptomyces sp. KHY 26]|uniref:hypothetical protein n=1 Tax=Streptomyces sp. KHY 26 TaxID=3097359 RepID=UPI00376EDB2B